MLPVNMLSDINMEFFQAFNPLYAVPIVAVIVCAFLVYAFGFKSPVPPPSFEGIEEEKKYPKKRRVKENQKKEKLLQNGKANGGIAKGNAPSSKKKETTEKPVAVEKAVAVEKTNAVQKTPAPVVEKKGNKKARLQNEKKSAQEKNDVISHDDFNEDGWVRLSKKEKRVKKPKMEIRYVPSVLSYDADANKSDDNSKADESPKSNDEISEDISAAEKKRVKSAEKKRVQSAEKKRVQSAEKKQVLSAENKVTSAEKEVASAEKEVASAENKQVTSTEKKQTPATEKKQAPATDKKQKKKEAEIKNDVPVAIAEKTTIQNVVVEGLKPEIANLDKQPTEVAVEGTKVLEESKKPKKKKKKNKETIQLEKNSSSEPENVSDAPAAQIISEIPAPQEIIKPVIVEDLATVDKGEKDQPSEVKNSNVAFDELAGLYPEAKQQKKKKKARRD